MGKAETKNHKSSPKNDLGRSSPLRAQVGKANSTAAAAVLATTTTTVVVVGGKQTKKKFEEAATGR